MQLQEKIYVRARKKTLKMLLNKNLVFQQKFGFATKKWFHNFIAILSNTYNMEITTSKNIKSRKRLMWGKRGKAYINIFRTTRRHPEGCSQTGRAAKLCLQRPSASATIPCMNHGIPMQEHHKASLESSLKKK